MGRKYLNRNNNEEPEKDDIEDEDPLEESPRKMLERVGPNRDEPNQDDTVLREIAIQKELARLKSKQEQIKDEIKTAGHQTRTTNQYQKFINAHIEDRVSRIDSIRKAKEQFDHDIKNLKDEDLDVLERINDLSIKGKSNDTLNEILQSMLKHAEMTRSKLEYYKNRVKDTEKDLEQQEKTIEKIKLEIIDKNKNTKTDSSRETQIKKEIHDLSKKYDLDEIRKIINILNKSDEV